MVQFLSINFFLGFLQFLLGFSKVPFFFGVTLYIQILERLYLPSSTNTYSIKPILQVIISIRTVLFCLIRRIFPEKKVLQSHLTS